MLHKLSPKATSPPIRDAAASLFCIYYANEPPSKPIVRLLALFSCMYFPEREPRCAEAQQLQSLCAPSRLRALRSPGEQTQHPALNNALFFYFYTTGYPVCTSDKSPERVLMDGVAWIPNVIQWRWTLAFVNWGISRFRFCLLCWGRRAHQSVLTIGKDSFTIYWFLGQV